jgi:signal transduction histidine kinase
MLILQLFLIVAAIPLMILTAVMEDRELAGKQLARLSRSLIEAQEEERKRIAREVHDDYSQRLAMLAIDVQKLADEIGDSSPGTSHQLVNCYQRISELSADMHSLSHQLHSSTLESLGLIAGIKGFCREFAEAEHVQVDFTHENVPRSIPGDVALCFFRIVQEGLRNVKRHSGIEKANVHIEWSGESLHLAVYDEGKGFDLRTPPAGGGIGIWSMRERLRLSGGRLQIQSHQMQGTKIDAWLPLRIE